MNTLKKTKSLFFLIQPDILNISFTEELINSNPKLQLFSGDGKLVLSQFITNSENSINVSHFTKGIYFVSLSNETKIISTKKIIIN